MIKYDYAVLDAMIDAMKAQAQRIIEETEQQRKHVNEIMGDWQGSTAEAYNSLCNDLESDLRANADILEQMRAKMHSGVDEMQVADKNGAKHVYH
ncbi:WXG100 family type VII secretion target [Amycolatopsis sp. NPDC058986]|uniref:WXG100 family type VII secretion target n=1 Tax=unclassified Amycolatopsis TaxID=2618356 RepID=UPI00366CC5BC